MTIDKVKKLVAKQLNIGLDKIKDDSKLVEDLGADSLDMVEMLMTLEEEFGITIPDEEASEMTTIQAVVDVINSKAK